MAITVASVQGQFGSGGTFFTDSPVIVNISGLVWPSSSSINVVHMNVVYSDKVYGRFHAETGGGNSISFDISSALRSLWDDYDYSYEVAAAQSLLSSGTNASVTRNTRSYTLVVWTEYIDEYGDWIESAPTTISGGSCTIGGSSELERYLSEVGSDVSSLAASSPSRKPSEPERIGPHSIISVLSWNEGAQVQTYYNENGNANVSSIVRDSATNYVDFLFVNRRGAVETCAAQTLDAMNVNVSGTTYTLGGAPSFSPKRSLMRVGEATRRSWSMSSGYCSRAWATWWAEEFLAARKWWMRYGSKFLPVVIDADKKPSPIYDKTKQQMPCVDFTAELALDS